MTSGVPEKIVFATKPDIALEQMPQAIVADIPISLVLADAGYGDETTHAKRQPFPKITSPALQRAQRYVHSDRPIQHLRLSVALASAS